MSTIAGPMPRTGEWVPAVAGEERAFEEDEDAVAHHHAAREAAREPRLLGEAGALLRFRVRCLDGLLVGIGGGFVLGARRTAERGEHVSLPPGEQASVHLDRASVS